jgi:hypothetical protein
MQNRDNHHAANGLRLGVLLPSLIVLALCLFALKKAVDNRSSAPVDQTNEPHVRPITKPGQQEEIVKGPIVRATESDLHSSSAVSQAKRIGSSKDQWTDSIKPVVPADNSTAGKTSKIESRPVTRATASEVKGALITGTVILRGKPPAEKVVDLSSDPVCGKLHKEPLMTRFYVVGTNGGLGDVVVHIQKGFDDRVDMALGPAVLEERNCEFRPYVLAIQTGQKIVLTNADSILHSFHSIPRDTGNREFTWTSFPLQGGQLKLQFGLPEMYLQIKCDFHPWMLGYICVFDHPYFAITADDGKFTLQNVPPGNYVVEAIHRKLGYQRHEVHIINRNDTVPLNFEFDAGDQRPFNQQTAKATP